MIRSTSKLRIRYCNSIGKVFRTVFPELLSSSTNVKIKVFSFYSIINTFTLGFPFSFKPVSFFTQYLGVFKINS